MTTIERYNRRDFKAFQDSDEELQLSWIKGLVEQVEFANKPDVLSDFVLQLKIRRRFEV